MPKFCIYENCKTQPRYGYKGTKPTHCKKHLLNNMICNPTKKCYHPKCKEMGIYGISLASKRHCVEHKLPNEQNLIEGVCSNCGLTEIVNCYGICTYCHGHAKFKKQYLQKQLIIKKVLETNIGTPEIYDKIVNIDCNKRRPDFVYDGIWRKLVIEVDEHQHQRNGYDCEIRRMFEISQAFGMNTIFIRYNPDSFKTQGKLIKISEQKKQETLIRWIKFLINEPINITTDIGIQVQILYLFYDEYIQNTTRVESLDSKEILDG